AARSTYDAAYRGTGNWPFNTAYAARFGLNAFVTQLRSLAEVERFVRAGIPVVASIASGPGELNGFLFSGGTNGHLVVIVGFDATGQPIVNDPAAWTNSAVRRIYDRGQFEHVWLRGSAGTVYIIHPPQIALPALPDAATPNW
ncbi:MAG: C39 family peptidase, partial [Chloroflexi bacterium]|nr:C39 family peptidase [Chloroflexota bacterium]